MVVSKSWLWFTAITLATTSGWTTASAEKYPSRPVHFVVGFAAGGGTDLLTRMVASKLAEKWKQPVVVDNKPGGGGAIGANAVAQARPDGYTIGWIASSLTTLSNLSESKLAYDPVTSFAPITEVAYVPDVIGVTPSLPVHSLKELVALAKSKPGQLNFSSAGLGSPGHLQMILLMQETGTKMEHVPYSGGPAAVVAVVSGETQLVFVTLPPALGSIESGSIRPIAVSSHIRSPLIPDVPTVAEALGLPSFSGADSDWTGVVAPAGTPREIIDDLNKDIAEVVREQDLQQSMANIGFVPMIDSPEEFGETIKGDLARWAPMLKK